MPTSERSADTGDIGGAMAGERTGPAPGQSLALSVHGPAGVLDLVVPPGAQAEDLAREYADQSGLGAAPLLWSRSGEPLAPDATLVAAGVVTGDLLVATTAVLRPATTGDRGGAPARAEVPPGPLAPVWSWCAAAAALLAGWAAGRADDPTSAVTVSAVLLAAAVVGVVPTGRLASQRVLAAPAFAGAAAYAVLADPDPERLPLVLGMCGVAAAVCAAVGRALSGGPDEALRTWIAGGLGFFALAGGAALAGLPAAVVFSVALVVAVLAARFVPLVAVDVDDHHLIDLDRLAVTAWSARERPPARRGRIVVPAGTVAEVAGRAARTLAAAAAAIAVVAVPCAVLLLGAVDARFDLIGVRCLVFFAGAALLLTARSHRHAAPRVLLRLGGLGCWLALAGHVLVGAEPPGAGWRIGALAAVVALGVLLVVVAVATGRGWRSIWWSRRAEVAEGFAAAAALASLVPATGLFRLLWEIAP
ncbi:hypothetical protein GCM10009623_21730 [Nocardioides aestuarii]|uniref:EccD-like transmembrane domain-containing protein n=1 Tax=Nocardioides aestuarii TaxID=252231 RepID=A0ABW4TNL9_9ACTN